MIVDWFNKGFIEVIPVAPPDVVIAENVSSLKTAGLGKAPGKPTPRGWVGLHDWLNFRMTPAHCRIFDQAQCSVGLRSEKYPGVDIDVLDERLSNEIAEIALEVLGFGYKRVGRHPKQLLMYATEEKIHKKSLDFLVDDTPQKVEILGVGSQYVVEGIHPFTKKPYEISEKESLTPTSLTVITLEQVNKFLEKVVERLDLYGYEVRQQSSGERTGETPRELLIASNLELLREAVELLPNTGTWDEWVRVGAAIKAATQNDEPLGLELWTNYSVKVEHKPFDPDETQGIWDRMKPPYRVGADWLYREASKHSDFNYAKTLPMLTPVARPVTNDWYPGSPSWIAHEFQYSVLNRLKVVLEWKTCILRRTQNWEVDDQNVKTLTMIGEYLKKEIFPNLHRITEDPVQRHKELSRYTEHEAILKSLTKATDSLVVRAQDLDKNPDILNTVDGKICLQTSGKIQETIDDTSDISLLVAGVKPDFDMPTPLWDSFLDDITGNYEETDVGGYIYTPDPEMKEYLQVYAGYAATGHTNEHIYFLLHGKGGNGKSTFLKTLQDVLGDYADTVPGDMFCITKKDMSHYKSKFHGRRLIVSSEFSQRAVWDLGELKRLTGGDVLDARNLYKDPFKFAPTHTVLIASNNKPKIEYIDQAVKRRTRLIPFDCQLPKSKEDPHLQKKLSKEYPGILAWIIRGSMKWYQEGFPKTPKRVLIATDEYFGDNDLIGLWLDECAILDDDAKSECDPVFKSWQLFLSQSKETMTSQTQFVELLKTHGIYKKQHRGKRYYWGIKLKSEEDRILHVV